MNWREIEWNIVTLAMLIGAAIIVVGTIVGALDASALNVGSFGADYKLREFLHVALGYVWYGGLVIAVAQLADRTGLVMRAGWIDWNIGTLVKLLGVAIIAVGIIVTLWDLQALNNFAGGVSKSESTRTAIRGAIDFVWRGTLLILLAEVADRMDPRNPVQAEPLPDEDMPPPTVEHLR